MKKLIALSCLLILSACQGNGGLQAIDNRAFLNSLDGPKVPTIEGTQQQSARSFEKAGDFKSAVQIYQQLLERKPDDKELMFAMAEAQRRLGDNEKAITFYDGALQKDPAMVSAKEGKALALLSKGDFETPIPIFEDVLKTDPKRWKSLNGMGILFATRNMQPEAQQYFREALKQSPSNISVMNNLGLSQALDRNTNAAIETLAKASALTPTESPEHKRVDLNLALVYAIAGKLENAKSVASQYFSGATLNNNMGLYAHLAKDDQLSKAYLNMALSQSKTFYDRAWENLQALSTSSGNVQSSEVKIHNKSELSQQLAIEPMPKLPVSKPKPTNNTNQNTPAKNAKEMVDDKIIGIINSSGEETIDKVQPSPIP